MNGYLRFVQEYIFWVVETRLGFPLMLSLFKTSKYLGAGATFWLDVVRQFKTDLVRRLEGLVFEEKKFLT